MYEQINEHFLFFQNMQHSLNMHKLPTNTFTFSFVKRKSVIRNFNQLRHGLVQFATEPTRVFKIESMKFRYYDATFNLTEHMYISPEQTWYILVFEEVF